MTYHPRSASCQPPHLYQHSNNQQKQARARSADRTKSTPKRFDGSPVEIPGFMRNNGSLHHEELSLGQKQYIWGVARIYSVTQLMKLKQRQYQSLLDYEFSRRIQNKDLKEHERLREWKEYLRYSKFIKCYEQVTCWVCTPTVWNEQSKAKDWGRWAVANSQGLVSRGGYYYFFFEKKRRFTINLNRILLQLTISFYSLDPACHW